MVNHLYTRDAGYTFVPDEDERSITGLLRGTTSLEQ